MAKLVETVLRNIRQNNLFFPDERVLVAVSGGPDSLVLLHMLHFSGQPLVVATFDHQIRPDSAEDVGFVQSTAVEWGVPCYTGSADVPAQASGIGLELAARQARYSFLAQVARQVNVGKIVVAHHLDDQAETVLLHVLRGAGLSGLQAMRFASPVPDAPDLMLVRPLLNVTREEIERYCQDHDLHPRQDASNQDTTYTRNAIRHNILPVLESVNPQVAAALVRLADSAAVDVAFIEQMYREQVEPLVRRQADRLYLSRVVFDQLHPAMQRRFLRQVPEAEHVHIIQACDVAQHGEVGAVAAFPGGWQLRVDYADIVLERAGQPRPTADWLLLDQSVSVRVPGLTPVGAWSLEVTAEPIGRPEVPIAVPPDAEVLLRGRQSGDRFAPPGLYGHTQSIKKWMINRKIPRHLRDRIPVLIIDKHIVGLLIEGKWITAHGADSGPSKQIHYFSIIIRACNACQNR